MPQAWQKLAEAREGFWPCGSELAANGPMWHASRPTRGSLEGEAWEGSCTCGDAYRHSAHGSAGRVSLAGCEGGASCNELQGVYTTKTIIIRSAPPLSALMLADLVHVSLRRLRYFVGEPWHQGRQPNQATA